MDIAQTGVDARRYLATTRYDLMILDIALPMRGEDSPDRDGGIKLLDEMVERGTYHLPLSVVGLTGYEDLWEEFADSFHLRLWTLDRYVSGTGGWVDRLNAKVKYVVARAGQTDPLDYRTDLCVIAGLHEPELVQLRRLAWHWSSAYALDEIGYYHQGIFVSKDRERSVIAAAAPRMGMVSAALLALQMIIKFRPRLIATIGICAGINPQCAIGDVLVADPAWDWQMGKYAKGALSFAPDQIDIPTEIRQRFTQLYDDKQLWFEIHREFQGNKPSNLPTVRIGPVASGSSVLADEKMLIGIAQQHRKLLGVEMELYGVYAAARDCSPPKPIAFGVKAVSDFADNKKSDEFREYAAHVSVRALAAFCERYMGDFRFA
jgi:nucleoside phosphorylase